MKLGFTKMHGLGNDFILIDCLRPEGAGIELADLPTVARRLCHRRFGIGADQLLFLSSSGVADFRMGIFNADGSEVEMCGNGIRCLAKYIWDRGLTDKKVIGVETLAGIIRPEKIDDLVRVDMGEPVFDPEKIPVDINRKSEVGSQKSGEERKTQKSKPVIDYPLQIDDREFKITCVSMGNPHAVIIVDNVSEYPVPYYGPLIENHQLFPKMTNVEFVEVLSPAEITMRVWERGVGETMACGTGASASAVAAHLKGLTERDVSVRLAGGALRIEWAGDGHVYMTGPAVEVFTGELDLASGMMPGP
ncbi:MAG TPA: diaminopimelate epimerase [Thermodesulfovibrionales bacterium]|nr:diaminopimelate epimerase [Thermodesulfovibrionales bacterium]